ncbi:MAG: RsmB/NOP family class I SAM-dependent RNA methyltransferase [Lachnospiraceae bacterium]|nr:RsmB/NOP family class I SAM-dependent RNA methyltransferase [Lachnospiraceae bacterium]
MFSLPEKYSIKMKALLGEDGFKKYIESFSVKPLTAIRINTAKTSLQDWDKICPFDTEKVPWCDNGFIINNASKTDISKHPYYFAGLYYIQEPSAMLPASILPINKGDKVLDLCAAPGGKSVAIASKLNGSGLLVANDISVSRTAALVKNLQVAGAFNTIVTAETPGRLSLHFKEYFDKILLDVPCSGEGMFRRKPDMVKDWLDKGPLYYAEIQKDILDKAYNMLKPGGSLVYSTCTFSIEEDEGMMQWFTDTYKDMEICSVPFSEGFSPGRPDMLVYGSNGLKNCIRIFPHIAKGEGHFAALLKKRGGHATPDTSTSQTCKPFYRQGKKNNNKKDKTDNNWQEEIKEFIPEHYFKNYCPVKHNDTIQLVHAEMPETRLLRVMQNGLLAGYAKKHFEPSCQLALAAMPYSYKSSLNLPSSDINVIKYLKGETINIDTSYNVWVLVNVDGFPLGWGKADGHGRLKNKYNAGWRML